MNDFFEIGDERGHQESSAIRSRALSGMQP